MAAVSSRTGLVLLLYDRGISFVQSAAAYFTHGHRSHHARRLAEHSHGGSGTHFDEWRGEARRESRQRLIGNGYSKGSDVLEFVKKCCNLVARPTTLVRWCGGCLTAWADLGGGPEAEIMLCIGNHLIRGVNLYATNLPLRLSKLSQAQSASTRFSHI